ncbi:hypothetical protein IP76_14775 [Rhizobium sp. AAP43]|nr:hypothetical protein IP76_14775 [Rhizobium sp. AAP43]
MKSSVWKLAIPVLGSVALAPLLLPSPTSAARLANPVAEFAGIDKITGRITTFDVYVDETVQFGALQVTPKVCYSRDESEAQKVDAFIEVDEITLDRKIRRIFSGWMFADSPALNAVEHPIYDVWLTGCKATSDVPAPQGVKGVQAAPEPAKPAETPAASAPAAPPSAASATPPSDPSATPQTNDAGFATQGEPSQAAVPPLEAPQEVPAEVLGGALPPADAPLDGQPLPEEQPLAPPPPVTPPGSVGLF